MKGKQKETEPKHAQILHRFVEEHEFLNLFYKFGMQHFPINKART